VLKIPAFAKRQNVIGHFKKTTVTMTPEEEIELLKKEIKDLDNELQDLDLLEKYYSNADPKWREKIEALIKINKRAIKLIKILDL
jgi:hypothetical protein